MDRRLSFVAVAVVSLLLSGRAMAQAKFKVGVDPCAAIPAATGEQKTFDVFATLTTSDNTSADGAQGWSLSISVDGATVNSVALKGVIVSTIWDTDEDLDPATPLVHKDPYDQDLGSADMFTRIANKATHKDDPTRLGAISAVILKGTEKQVLQPNGTQKILKLNLTSKAAPVTVNVNFENGFKSPTSQPTNNVITFGGKSITPEFVPCAIKVGEAPPPGCTLTKDYAYYFGDATPSDAAFNIAGGNQVKVLMRNKLDVPGFSFGVKKDAANLTFESTLGWKNPADPLDIRLVDLAIAIATTPDTTQVTGDVLKGNSATGAPAAQNITEIVRGAALTGFDQIDFWGPDLAPLVGGPGVTLGYIVDKNELKKTIPLVTDPTSGCAANEIVILKFVGVVEKKFSRGDGNGDGKINVTDAVIIAQNIFFSAAHFFDCDDMLDVNNDGSRTVADPVFLLNYMFLHGQVPAAPFKVCGTDPATPADTLTCAQPNCT